jgi:hypothetical protein
MARLTESQLAGFRTGTSSQDAETPRPRRRPTDPPRDPEPRTDQPALALDGATPSTISILGPVPPPPTRGEARHKVGLTLPLELAEQVRTLTQQGYAFADLVMFAYEHHRDELVREHEVVAARQLQRRTIGRSSFTITLSAAERDALDALGRNLDTTRSHTVAALLGRHLSTQQADIAATAEPPERRSLA